MDGPSWHQARQAAARKKHKQMVRIGAVRFTIAEDVVTCDYGERDKATLVCNAHKRTIPKKNS
jgi:hypothetical protein